MSRGRRLKTYLIAAVLVTLVSCGLPDYPQAKRGKQNERPQDPGGDDPSQSSIPGSGDAVEENGKEKGEVTNEPGNEDAEPPAYTPEDLVESLRKTLLKLKSRPLAEAEELQQFSAWKANRGKDIGVEVGIAQEEEQSARSYYCHWHGVKIACHSIQSPGLSGNPDSYVKEEEPAPGEPLDPIDPF